jgi:hypothetical protein
MIQSVEVINFLGNSMVMELKRPEKSGFLIFNMTGIGPEKGEINLTNIATADGGIYNSSRLPARNIVMSLRYFVGEGKNRPTVEEIRHESYKYFPIKKPLTLIFNLTNRVAEIKGYVEANEPVIFSKETHAQISILCPDPFFYNPRPVTTLFAGVVPMFEFPFSNESLDEPLLIMGEMLIDNTRTIWYKGDADVGVLIHIYAFGQVKDLVIFDPESGGRMEIDEDRLYALTGASLNEGDQIVISTVRGDKYIKFIRNGVETNILNTLNRDAYWFQLSKGDNLFSYSTTSGLANLNFTIEHRIVYEGI